MPPLPYPQAPTHPYARPSRRRGWTLLYTITSIGVGAMVLGTVVPLFLAGRRQAEHSILRARETAMAREIAARFGSDVRQASQVELGPGGRSLRLVLPRVEPPGRTNVALYRMTAGGLVRELRPAAGAAVERLTWGSPLASARFGRDGRAMTARLELRRSLYGRETRYELECSAVPRSAP